MAIVDSTAAAERELSELPALSELATELRTYPLRLLRLVCDEHRRRGGVVPDHGLKLMPYLGETALRALVEGGYVRRTEDSSRAIFAYEPTDEGLALVAGIEAPSAPLRPRRNRRSR